MQTLCLSLDTKLGSYCPLVKKGLEVEKRSPVEKSRESEHLLLCFKLESDTLWEDDNRAASLVPRGHKRHLLSRKCTRKSLSPLLLVMEEAIHCQETSIPGRLLCLLNPLLLRKHFFFFVFLWTFVTSFASLVFRRELRLVFQVSQEDIYKSSED